MSINTTTTALHHGSGEPIPLVAKDTPESAIMVSRRIVLGLGLAAGAAAASGGAVGHAFSRDMEAARALTSPRLGKVVASRFGDLEYAEAGSGAPILMIHGTGGGFDQGLLFARRLVDLGYRVIAPSRFGYLRSAFPSDPSSENQADAFIDLLDALDIDRIAVAGGSAGALSAAAFAIRHPDRCAAFLPIVPASYAPERPSAEPWSPFQEQLAAAVLRSDFLFWSALKTMPDVLTRTLLATDPALIEAARPEEQARAREILERILPISDRARGLLNDTRLASNPARMALETITAPTYAVSVEDDSFGTADAARFIARTVPGARLTIYPTGGHIFIGRDSELFAAIDAFLREIGYR